MSDATRFMWMCINTLINSIMSLTVLYQSRQIYNKAPLHCGMISSKTLEIVGQSPDSLYNDAWITMLILILQFITLIWGNQVKKLGFNPGGYFKTNKEYEQFANVGVVFGSLVFLLITVLIWIETWFVFVKC